MQFLIALIQKVITNPKFEAFVIIGLTSFLKNKFMEEKIEEKLKSAQPLHLPRGSVRALITLTLLLILAGSFVFKYEVPAEFYALTIFAIGYYIGYRTDNAQLKEIKI